MNALSLKTLLLVLAILLFIVAVIDDTGSDWIPLGLAVDGCRPPRLGSRLGPQHRRISQLRTIEGRVSGPQSR